MYEQKTISLCPDNIFRVSRIAQNPLVSAGNKERSRDPQGYAHHRFPYEPYLGDGTAWRRSRSWKEMEMVAKTGGVVCTWPLAFNRKTVQRVTFLDWAREALAMKQRLGIDHIGLGTDNGGLFKTSRVIKGYKDIRDMTKLAEAMLEVGLTKKDISAFMGGNLLRVLKACIG